MIKQIRIYINDLQNKDKKPICGASNTKKSQRATNIELLK